jgi:hypothetical protein
MKLQLKITTTDGETHEVNCGIADFIAWERHSKSKTSDLAHGIGLEDMAFLAHSALKRSGQNIKPFEGWINNVEEIEVVDSDPKAIQ